MVHKIWMLKSHEIFLFGLFLWLIELFSRHLISIHRIIFHSACDCISSSSEDRLLCFTVQINSCQSLDSCTLAKWGCSTFFFENRAFTNKSKQRKEIWYCYSLVALNAIEFDVRTNVFKEFPQVTCSHMKYIICDCVTLAHRVIRINQHNYKESHWKKGRYYGMYLSEDCIRQHFGPLVQQGDLFWHPHA